MDRCGRLDQFHGGLHRAGHPRHRGDHGCGDHGWGNRKRIGDGEHPFHARRRKRPIDGQCRHALHAQACRTSTAGSPAGPSIGETAHRAQYPAVTSLQRMSTQPPTHAQFPRTLSIPADRTPWTARPSRSMITRQTTCPSAATPPCPPIPPIPSRWVTARPTWDRAVISATSSNWGDGLTRHLHRRSTRFPGRSGDAHLHLYLRQHHHHQRTNHGQSGRSRRPQFTLFGRPASRSPSI